MCDDVTPDVYGPDGLVVARAIGPGADERAPLIAEAPAMARMLLAIEWEAEDGDGCPSCKFSKEQGHGPECEMDALFIRLGVRG